MAFFVVPSLFSRMALTMLQRPQVTPRTLPGRYQEPTSLDYGAWEETCMQGCRVISASCPFLPLHLTKFGSPLRHSPVHSSPRTREQISSSALPPSICQPAQEPEASNSTLWVTLPRIALAIHGLPQSRGAVPGLRCLAFQFLGKSVSFHSNFWPVNSLPRQGRLHIAL